MQANIKLIKEFQKDYSFSDIVFAFEVDLYEYQQGTKPYPFLNEELKIDSSITLKNAPVFILTTNSYKVFQLRDEKMQLLNEKTPEYFNNNFHTQYQFLPAKIAQSISYKFVLRKTAAYFNRKLFSIHKKLLKKRPKPIA